MQLPLVLHFSYIYDMIFLLHYLRRTYLLTYLLAQWNRVFPQKLTGSQLFKKFPEFYGKQKFISVFTCARNLSLF